MKVDSDWLLILFLVSNSGIINCQINSVTNFLHLEDYVRYASCPFHAQHNFEFACFKKNISKIDRIITNSDFRVLNIRESMSELAKRTILFVGDSLVKNQFVSLACLLWEADNTILESDLFLSLEVNELRQQLSEKYAKQYGLKSGKKIRIMAIHSKTFNIEIQFLFTGTLLNIHPTQLLMINESTILNYDIDLEWKALMSDVFNPYLKVPDIIIISAGHHYDMGKYMTVPHSTKIRVDQNIYRLALQRVCSILSNTTNNNDISPKIVVRNVPPRHYSKGDWNTNGKCSNLVPLTGADLSIALKHSNYITPLKLSEIIHEVGMQYGFSVLDILPYSLNRADAMVGSIDLGYHGANVSDCSHYCVPGIPDLWNTKLMEFLI